MIKLSILYTNQDGATFDMAYYCNRHMPKAQELLGATEFTVDQGLSGGMPGSPAPYIVMGHLLFDSLEVFQANIATHAPELMADIPNYTNTKPVIQLSEVK